MEAVRVIWSDTVRGRLRWKPSHDLVKDHERDDDALQPGVPPEHHQGAR